MPEVHLVVGVSLIAANLVAGVWGGLDWLQQRPSPGFWYALRIAQASVILQTFLGLLLVFSGHHADELHILYGVLPLLVSILAESLRASTAQMVLDSRGFESNDEVGRLPAEEQRGLVLTIVQREIGVMALSAVVVVVLLARAAATA